MYPKGKNRSNVQLIDLVVSYAKSTAYGTLWNCFRSEILNSQQTSYKGGQAYESRLYQGFQQGTKYCKTVGFIERHWSGKSIH